MRRETNCFNQYWRNFPTCYHFPFFSTKSKLKCGQAFTIQNLFPNKDILFSQPVIFPRLSKNEFYAKFGAAEIINFEFAIVIPVWIIVILKSMTKITIKCPAAVTNVTNRKYEYNCFRKKLLAGKMSL